MCDSTRTISTRKRPSSPSNSGPVRWSLLVAIALAISAGFTGSARTAEEKPKEFYCDFRHSPLPPELTFYNAEEGKFFQSEPQGLRISLPKTWIHPWGGVGFRTAFSFGGDFEATTTFEVLQAQTPQGGYGVGVGLALVTVDGTRASIDRLVRASGEPILLCDHTVEGGRTVEKREPCAETAGRLRLKRLGTTLSFLWSPQRDGEDFQELDRIPFEKSAIERVRLVALTGRQPCEVSIRLIDLRIRSQTSDLPAASVSPGAPAPESNGKFWWLIAGGTALLLGMCLAVGLAVRQSRRSRNLVGGASSPDEQDQTVAAAAPISIACTACGKQLRAKAELAGKKVKCTQCGQAVLVRSALLLLPALGMVSTFTSAADGQDAPTKARQEYYLSFKGRPQNDKDFRLVGPDAEQCVKFEPDGLRITLPLGYPKERPPTGLATGIAVQGDFEITLRFTILQEPEPDNAGPIGTRSGLLVGIGTQPKDVARVTRSVNPQGGTKFVAWTNADAGERHLPTARPTTAKSGRLRLVRNGPNLAYYAAEEESNSFVLLQEQQIGTADLRDVSIVAQTNSPQAALDVRFADLRIRAESLPTVSSAAMSGTTTSAPTESKSWLVVGELVGLALGLTLATGLIVWFYRRQNRRAKEAPAVDHATIEAAPAVVCFSCACGKQLKAKTELAGKKVKCSQCGQAALVPEINRDEASPTSE